LEDKIIVKQAEAETQTASGLFIPDNAKEKPQQGEVLAVGPGRRKDPGGGRKRGRGGDIDASCGQLRRKEMKAREGAAQ